MRPVAWSTHGMAMAGWPISAGGGGHEDGRNEVNDGADAMIGGEDDGLPE